MPLSIKEVKEIKKEKREEREKVINFFKQQEREDGETVFFNSQEISQETGISIKSAADILEAIHMETRALQPIELQDKFQDKEKITTMRLWKVEKDKIFYYGAEFYKQEKIKFQPKKH